MYRIVVKLPNATGRGPGTTLVEFENAKHVGWSEYINDVGEAFWTITQGDPKLNVLTDDLLDSGLHVLIYRSGTLVWAGWIGETDETETDVIFYAYSYVAGLFWMHSDWNHLWTGKNLATISDDLIDRAVALSQSALEWITIGTIQAPATTSGGSTAILIPEYRINYKRILFALQEIAAMAASDTTNRVVFEITPEGVFNFWARHGTTRTDQMWEYGGNVSAYRRLRTPMDRRNVVLGVGSSPRDIVVRNTQDDVPDRMANSRREEAVFYSWVRDEEEIERVNKLRLARGLRTDNVLHLTFLPGRVSPARSADASFGMADLVPVRIYNGNTQINEQKLVTGQQVVFSRGAEHLRAFVQDRL